MGNIIYAVHATGIDAAGGGQHAALIWYKIDATTNAVIQEGTLSSPTFDWYQPSIAANEKGDVVISFNQSGTAVGGADSYHGGGRHHQRQRDDLRLADSTASEHHGGLQLQQRPLG